MRVFPWLKKVTVRLSILKPLSAGLSGRSYPYQKPQNMLDQKLLPKSVIFLRHLAGFFANGSVEVETMINLVVAYLDSALRPRSRAVLGFERHGGD